MVPLDKGLQRVNVKQKRFRQIYALRLNQTYPRIIQAYSGIFKTLSYPEIFKTGISRTPTYYKQEAYSEPRHIHNPAIFRTRLYSERWHIQNLRHIQYPVAHPRGSVNNFHS